ncbi:MAG: hypothetical protein CL821_07330 [Crocinitomicaceae bacterium]|nr:hypothetical protein [Crocinitomicaceae bacterium]|tara:strand:- start:173 stop:904 length:732 start_codon:yes stop_codon:yes gene_type:complete
MKKIIISLVVVLGLTQKIKSQVITAVPCDMLGMSVNVGSSQTSISIYHSGQYMTHPRENNIFNWEFTDSQGNILHQDTIVDGAFCNFGHNWSLTDTINVSVHFINDSANLDAWYMNQGLPLNGNSINCLFEDQLYWSTGTNNPWGSWTFVHNNPGLDITNVNESKIVKSNLKVYPSPTSNYLKLEGPKEDYSLQVFNIQGQLFHELNNISGYQNIDVSFLPSGLYFLNINYYSGNETTSFIKL